MKPGIYADLTRAEYDAIQAANYSTIKHYAAPTPAHARERMLHPREASPEMRLGTLCEAAIEDPARLERDYIAMPDFTIGLLDDKGQPYSNPRATKKYKQLVSDFGRENQGREFVDVADLDVARIVAESVAQNAVASELLSTGECQVAVVWIDQMTGFLCKGLLDRITTWNGKRCVVDLKTAADASPAGFLRSCETLLYHVQAAMYMSGMAANGQHAGHFLHVVCETVPPYGVAVYEMTDAFLSIGLQRLEQFMRLHADCTAANRWPGYPDGIQTLDPSPWLARKNGLES